MTEYTKLRPMAMDEDAYLRRELCSEEPEEEEISIPPEAIEAIGTAVNRLGRAIASASEAFCKAMVEDKKPMTNADWVRSMSDEELCALFLADCEIIRPDGVCLTINDCETCIKSWLKQEHKEDNSHG